MTTDSHYYGPTLQDAEFIVAAPRLVAELLAALEDAERRFSEMEAKGRA